MNLTPLSDQKRNNKLSRQLLAYRKLTQYYHDNDKILLYKVLTKKDLKYHVKFNLHDAPKSFRIEYI